ncbi:MAG: alkaline phosphatase [Balneolaceae bacterium]|nr:MAG: alkaline phosphatase [Balneolaceae bacterium]
MFVHKVLKYYYLLVIFLFIIPVQKIYSTDPDPDGKPLNIILLIGDGMGYPQITAVEYLYGPLRMTEMTVKGMISTYSANRLVTDSAAGATALASGYKTNNSMLGILPDSTAVQSIAQYASELGKSTALVVSCSITHATPAAFVVNHHSRSDEFLIAEMYVQAGINMLMGAGWKYFLPKKEGGERRDERNLISEMKKLGYHYIDHERNLGEVKGRDKVIVFLDGEELAQAPFRGDQMKLLTEAALSQLSQNKKGFFVMIEGAQIDWAGHDHDFTWLMHEMIDFDTLVGAALDFAEKEGNTLVIVTSDHETGGLTLPAGRAGNRENFRHEFSTGGHTAAHVPVFAYGPSAELFTGSYDNTDVARKMFYLWGKEIEDLE